MERSAINIKQSERKGIHMEITNNIKYVGVNDHQVDLFEGQVLMRKNGCKMWSRCLQEESRIIW